MINDLSSVFFSKHMWYYVNALLLTAGFFRLMPKCGVKKGWAFVPYLRLFKLAQAADMEDTGFVWLISLAVSRGLTLLSHDMSESADWIVTIYVSALMAVSLVLLIHEIRIYIALCRMFGKRKLWVFLWLSASCIAAIVWGYSEKVQYGGMAEDKNSAAPLSGRETGPYETGLSVNINSRTVWDRFRRRALLRDIHLNIQPGRMVLLLGGSGAGKTTFINAVIGYEKADAKVTFHGKDIYKDYKQMKYDIALVPQQDLIRYDDRVLKTLTDAAILRLPESVSGKELDERVKEVLNVFGLETIADKEVEKLSGGQKKRLSIAMEYISDPDLFVLDEPDSGLDGVLARDLMTRLHAIARSGKTVIVITHSPDRVIDLFDDVIVLAKDAELTGRLVFFGSVEECRKFFGCESMEEIVRAVSRRDEGGDGRADELIEKFTEAANAAV